MTLEMKIMTIYFITGGFGFLGQYIVKALHEHDPDAELRVLGRTRRTTLLGVENLERVRWIQGGLTQPETYAHKLESVDAIIHNAALVSFRKSDADKIFKSNVIGTRELSQATLEAGCKNFIFISSISAIGFNPDGIADESMLPDMEYKRENDMYGFSKRTSEIELGEMTDCMRIITLNPSVVLGPGSDRIEAVFKMASWLPILPMLSYVNSFVDVRDVAQAVILALTKGRNGERYIVTAHNKEMFEFTRMALKASGKSPILLPVAGPGVRALDAILWVMDLLKLNPGIRRPSDLVVDKALSYEKIQREMGWEPQYTLEQSIADSVSFN
jgi:nucleoside-diphosphate-sugar epimerase